MHTSEGSSSRRRSTSSNPGYTDSSTGTHDFYPPGSGQSSYSQPLHGYYPFPNYSMPMPYQPQMYPPPPMYQPPPPQMYPPPPMYQPPPPHMYPPVPSQLSENQGENVTFLDTFLDKDLKVKDQTKILLKLKVKVKVEVKHMIFLVIQLIGETTTRSTSPFLSSGNNAAGIVAVRLESCWKTSIPPNMGKLISSPHVAPRIIAQPTAV
ncbi:hypothetical protein V6N11_008969 [Hibiscus sabdariffa]|uniref:Uncharacterized protein n=1 Tax=Hibiscus sabdariffa TaxID=183260 RepID=A0ABR2PPC0_9ROSI